VHSNPIKEPKKTFLHHIIRWVIMFGERKELDNGREKEDEGENLYDRGENFPDHEGTGGFG
jgi:hypothetical protein